MDVHIYFETNGFNLQRGNQYTPRELRNMATVLDPSFVQHPGIESLTDARRRKGMPLESLIPDELGGFVGKPSSFQMWFEQEHPHCWGKACFDIRKENGTSQYVFREYVQRTKENVPD